MYGLVYDGKVDVEALTGSGWSMDQKQYEGDVFYYPFTRTKGDAAYSLYVSDRNGFGIQSIEYKVNDMDAHYSAIGM